MRSRRTDEAYVLKKVKPLPYGKMAYSLQFRASSKMRLVDRLGEETEAFHDVIDGEAVRLLGPATAEDYRGYLKQLYGFVCPVERSIASAPGIDHYVSVREFQKHDLLRRDLLALHMTSDQIGRLPQCAVPSFKTPEEALGWAYPIERSTLYHGELFRHLASVIPGEIAFASSYLKCHFGAVGGPRESFEQALEIVEYSPRRAQQVIDGARAACYCLRAWRFVHDPALARMGLSPSAAP